MLNDKIALVTGASTGLGLATIRKFLKEGAVVFGVGSPSVAYDDLGDRFTFLPCNVTKEDAIKGVCAAIQEKCGKLDALVTISEYYFRGSVVEMDAARYTEASAHIFLAPILFTKYCNDLLHQSSNPSITHNVPMAAYMTEHDFLNSSLATAVINYTRQCAPQIRPVRVNAVLFGILTDHLLTEDEVAVFNTPERLAKIPAGRLGESADVANVTAFLASDRARYLNSGAWAVDGGYYTMNPRAMGNNGV